MRQVANSDSLKIRCRSVATNLKLDAEFKFGLQAESVDTIDEMESVGRREGKEAAGDFDNVEFVRERCIGISCW